MRIHHNQALTHLNSFRFPCVAEQYVAVERDEQLVEAVDFDGPITLLGDGTNVVLREHVAGRVIHLRQRGIKIEQESDRRYLVHSAAGESWHELVRRTLGAGIRGLENLALIPGSVGAAPIQNIGAYGRELEDVLQTVKVFDRSQNRLRYFSKSMCQFGYRDSRFKREDGELIVTGVKLRLGTQPLVTHYPDVAKRMRFENNDLLSATRLAETVTKIRRSKLPDHRFIGNVGSFFENPVVSAQKFEELNEREAIDGFETGGQMKIPAARLIDLCGWRGYRSGHCGVWPQQPLVLVNYGGGSATEVLALADRIKNDVFDTFGVTLNLEPSVVGTD